MNTAQITTTTKVISRGFAILATLIIWFVIWLLMGDRFSAARIDTHADAIANIVSTLCIALIGIMAGAVAIATSLKDSFWIRRFRSSGRMAQYLWFYGWTIFFLFGTHMLAIYALTNATMFRLLIAACLTSVLQVLWVMYQAHLIATRGGDNDTPDPDP